MKDWIKCIEEGNNYYKTVINGKYKKENLGVDIMYQMLCLSMEKYLQAILLFHQFPPDGHSLKNMSIAAGNFVYFSLALLREIKYVESFNHLSNDFYKTPKWKDIEGMVRCLNEIKYLATEDLSVPSIG